MLSEGHCEKQEQMEKSSNKKLHMSTLSIYHYGSFALPHPPTLMFKTNHMPVISVNTGV